MKNISHEKLQNAIKKYLSAGKFIKKLPDEKVHINLKVALNKFRFDNCEGRFVRVYNG